MLQIAVIVLTLLSFDPQWQIGQRAYVSAIAPPYTYVSSSSGAGGAGENYATCNSTNSAGLAVTAGEVVEVIATGGSASPSLTSTLGGTVSNIGQVNSSTNKIDTFEVLETATGNDLITVTWPAGLQYGYPTILCVVITGRAALRSAVVTPITSVTSMSGQTFTTTVAGDIIVSAAYCSYPGVATVAAALITLTQLPGSFTDEVPAYGYAGAPGSYHTAWTCPGGASMQIVDVY